MKLLSTIKKPIWIAAFGFIALMQFMLVMLGCNQIADLYEGTYQVLTYLRGGAPFVAFLTLSFPFCILVALTSSQGEPSPSRDPKIRRRTIFGPDRPRWLAPILFVNALGLLALLFLYYGLAQEKFREPPTRFPPRSEWPTEVISATADFRALTNKWRAAQAREIEYFFMRCRMRSRYDTVNTHYTPLTKRDIYHLLGMPDEENEFAWNYLTDQQTTHSQWLYIRFSAGCVSWVEHMYAPYDKPRTLVSVTVPPADYHGDE